MEAQSLELQGTWEEILAHSDELAGREVRVIVLPTQTEAKDSSSSNSLLKYAGTWSGDDLEECLQMVYETRSQSKF